MSLSEEAKAARKEYMRKWRRANKDKVNAYMKDWKKNNPDKVKHYNERYWEKKGKELDS